MSREKQIEEMVKYCPCYIGKACYIENELPERCDMVCQFGTYAEALYNAGYRKIPTTDWLTRGIPKEQLERKKREALEEAENELREKLGYRKQEWISVDERLPDRELEELRRQTKNPDKYYHCIIYICYETFGFVTDAWYGDDKFVGNHDYCPISNITHWMPLPEAPKKGGAE